MRQEFKVSLSYIVSSIPASEADILVPSAPFFFTLEADDNYFLTLLDQDTERNTK